ncbi:MAG TPA: NAD(P)-binding protein [Clostridiales bacterium]|nr:MAG: hypothetical protein BWY37_01558 [Firmicutes bacterium ADurb.Bin262]HOU09485.1 NAD(P)-binding protein [Clostridiales bacterium]HQH62716.1 NAD(P)-binding protein [Clostridiales bacterium]HQK72975.1 NAD(P)-binding protein [Clostridiales bacterium]
MSKKIIVAGAGHGGIAAAALLAKAGMDVTVYERAREGTLGYDWTDIFAPGALKAAGMGMPPREMYEYKTNMTFYSPNRKTPLTQIIPPAEREIKMERRDIYRHLIGHAQRCGARFVYGCDILGPLLAGNRVIGIKSAQGDIHADLVIDAAGVRTPLRTRLPAVCGIEKEPRRYEVLYVYRAFYDRACAEEPDAKYKIFLLPEGTRGIAWIAAEEGFTDLLVGRFEPFGLDEAERMAEALRVKNPRLGRKVLRGGRLTEIPVRQPLGVMVCDGYAAVGDSAFMTMPIIGSGIANSLRAAGMLAKTVLADKGGAYSAHTLWPYQVKYYKEIGAGLSEIACIKSLLMSITPAELDYCFEKGVLTAQDFAFGSGNTSLASMLKIKPGDAVNRAQALIGQPQLLKKAARTGAKIGKAALLMKAMPKTYGPCDVAKWSARVRKFYAGLIE